MYKKCENCYKDGKTPDEESCKRCEDDLKAKEQKLEEIKEILEIHKEDKCTICPKFDECFEQPSCDNVILQIIEGKENG